MDNSIIRACRKAFLGRFSQKWPKTSKISKIAQKH